MSSTAPEWFKSSHSGSDGGNCVEIATHPTAIHIRDSKTPNAPCLTVTHQAWTAFLSMDSTTAPSGGSSVV